MDRQALLAVVEDSWRQLDAAIADLDQAMMVEPGVVETWSIKDLLGHVAAWEQMALRHVDHYRRGEALGGQAEFTVDGYNASESARRRDWPLARTRDEVAETRQRLRTMLESMTDDEWQVVVGEGDRQSPLGDWVGGALGGAAGPGTHAADHAEHIRVWRLAREQSSADSVAA